MDTWQGKASNPTTLNKYLYADANPVMYVDPTGNMSLGGLMAGLRVQSILSTMANTARLARKAKIYKIYTGVQGIRSSLKNKSPHKFLYAENKVIKSGNRYDVGARGFSLVENIKNPSTVLDGVIMKTHTNKKQIRRDGDHLIRKVTVLTPLQYALWDSYIMQGSDANKCSIEYSFSGINCFSLTKKGVAYAKVVSKLKI